RRQCCRGGDRRVHARGTRLASAAGQYRYDQRDPVVSRDHWICALDSLLFVPAASLHGRCVEPDLFFHGADNRATAIAAAASWSPHWFVRHGEHGAESV